MRKLEVVYAIAVVMLFTSVQGGVAEPFFTQQDLFISGLDGTNIYRIPAVLVSPKGTILAFCEARQGDDGDPTDLVLKRSIYDGRPAEPRFVNGYARTFGYGVNWTPMQVVLGGNGQAITNPCPVVDHATGQILICCQEARGGLQNLLKNPFHERSFILKSEDDGVTWSKPQEITESVGGFVAGPGIGIQLRSGRLLIPGYSKEGSRLIYSDDHGQTWKAGAPVKNKGANESQVVELADGSLMMNMRQGGRCRYVAFSRDGGESWYKEFNEESLPDPGCQASLVRYPGQADKAKGLLLFSNPPHPGPFVARTDLTVRLSDNEGQSWGVSRKVYAGPGAYSCLAVLADGTIAMLYETGVDHPYEKITLARFNLEWLAAKPADADKPPDKPKEQATDKLIRQFAVEAKNQAPLELIELWKRWLQDAEKRKEFGLENEAFQTALTKWVGERLVRLLKEGNGNAEAAIALGRLGDREYVKDLVALYRNEDCDG